MENVNSRLILNLKESMFVMILKVILLGFIAKNGWTWPPITEILGQIKRFYLDTKNGKYLDTFLDKPLNQFYLS